MRARHRLTGVLVVGALLLLTGLCGLVIYRQGPQQVPPAERSEPPGRPVTFAEMRPSETLVDGYVSSRACKECHPRNHESWHASYHRTMTQVVTPETAIGDFDDVSVESLGKSFHLTTRGDQFWVTMEDPDSGQVIQCPLVMSTGSHHMQVYWYPFGRSRILGQMPLAYLKEDQRWVHRDAIFLTTHGPPTETGRWNNTCIDCHATHGRMRPRGRADLDTQAVEFGIACEACHGPGEQHVRIHQRVANGGKPGEIDPIVNPGSLHHDRASQVCGRCHSVTSPRRPADYEQLSEHGFRYRPGDDLHETRLVVRRDDVSRDILRLWTDLEEEKAIEEYFDSRFWSDGMVRISGREYNGLLESSCHIDGGMSCLSCHRMHPAEDDPRPLSEWANDQLQVAGQGDQMCLECHAATDFQTTAHTNHRGDSSGSRCVNCHMPHTTYGLMKAIRSHTIDSPEVAVSRRTGRPNACNLCHLDKTLAWTSDYLARWYGHQQPELNEDEKSISAAVLGTLTGDAGQRALWGWHMGWQEAKTVSSDTWLAPYLASMLDDPYHVLRYIAYRSLGRLDGFEDFNYDFMGPVDQRSEAPGRAMQRWSSGQGTLAAPIPAVLVEQDGQLRHELFEQLRKRRNDQAISLSE